MLTEVTFTQLVTWEEAVRWLVNQSDQQEMVVKTRYDNTPLQVAAECYWQSDKYSEIRKYAPTKLGYSLDIGSCNGIAGYAMAKDSWQVTALEPDSSSLAGVGAIGQLAQNSDLAVKVFRSKFHQIPGGVLIGNLTINSLTFPLLLKLLSIADSRPGRAYSFITHKPHSTVALGASHP
jgi:hypothetical protein